MSLNKVHFILSRPQMGENIGSVARAIKNFSTFLYITHIIIYIYYTFKFIKGIIDLNYQNYFLQIKI